MNIVIQEYVNKWNNIFKQSTLLETTNERIGELVDTIYENPNIENPPAFFLNLFSTIAIHLQANPNNDYDFQSKNAVVLSHQLVNLTEKSFADEQLNTYRKCWENLALKTKDLVEKKALLSSSCLYHLMMELTLAEDKELVMTLGKKIQDILINGILKKQTSFSFSSEYLFIPSKELYSEEILSSLNDLFASFHNPDELEKAVKTYHNLSSNNQKFIMRIASAIQHNAFISKVIENHSILPSFISSFLQSLFLTFFLTDNQEAAKIILDRKEFLIDLKEKIWDLDWNQLHLFFQKTGKKKDLLFIDFQKQNFSRNPRIISSALKEGFSFTKKSLDSYQKKLTSLEKTITDISKMFGIKPEESLNRLDKSVKEEIVSLCMLHLGFPSAFKADQIPELKSKAIQDIFQKIESDKEKRVKNENISQDNIFFGYDRDILLYQFEFLSQIKQTSLGLEKDTKNLQLHTKEEDK